MPVVPKKKSCSHGNMQLNFLKFIQIFSLILVMSSSKTYAQGETDSADNGSELNLEDELSLEEPLPQGQNAKQSVAHPQSGGQTDELSLELESADAATDTAASEELHEEIKSDNLIDAKDLPPDAISEAELDRETEGIQVESVEQEYLMKGRSFGAVLYNQNYNVRAEVLINSTATVDVSRKTSDFQNIGVMGRYAILPYEKVGTDINFSLSNSINHGQVNFSPILNLKGEVNVGYTFSFGRSTAFYLYGGLGYEYTLGKEIEEIIIPGGGTSQVGGILGVSKNLNIELSYLYSRHTISDKYFNPIIQAAINAGATTVDFDGSQASVTSNTILGRITYEY